MKSKVIIFLVSLFAAQLYAQGEKVLITEKKRGKRVVLFAENTTQDTLNVFFMVNAEGYRRSADKPVLKDILPNSKVKLITLIELTTVESNYTYELIVNDKQKSEAIDYSNKIIDIENVIKDKLVIFTMRNCEKCKLLLSKLAINKVPFKSYDIAQEPLRYRQFMRHIEDELRETSRIVFPVIWNKNHTIFGYDDLEILFSELNSEAK